MYFAVVKLNFQAEGGVADDRKALRSLTEKLRSRFKVCAAICGDEAAPTGLAIAVTALGSNEEKLSQMLDALTDFCESAGFGRIESEQTLLDHIDTLADFTEAD